MGKVEVYARFSYGNLRERDQLEDLGIDGSIILRWIFRKWDMRAWTGAMSLRMDRDSWWALVNVVMNLWAL